MVLGLFRSGESAQAKAADLLITGGALVELSAADARQVVKHMKPMLLKAGEVLFAEGEDAADDCMALVLDGEVTVESSVASAEDSMVVTVLGPGSLIGDMSLIDGAPRSATCTASTDLALAILTQEGLRDLMARDPAVAARLLMGIAKRMADHLRETNRKLMTFSQVSKALQQELDAAHGVNRRLLERMAAANPRGPLPAP